MGAIFKNDSKKEKETDITPSAGRELQQPIRLIERLFRFVCLYSVWVFVQCVCPVCVKGRMRNLTQQTLPLDSSTFQI